jgi:hypothetical protein
LKIKLKGRHFDVEIAAPAKLGSSHRWQFSKAHTGPRIA